MNNYNTITIFNASTRLCKNSQRQIFGEDIKNERIHCIHAEMLSPHWECNIPKFHRKKICHPLRAMAIAMAEAANILFSAPTLDSRKNGIVMPRAVCTKT